MFDKEKVLTPFTADKAKVGDVGWIAQTLEGIALQAQNQNDSISCDLIKVNSDIRKIGERFAFLGRRGGENVKGDFFYPAPYEFMQKKWVEEVGLKVGDKVRIVKKWEKGEGGFDCAMGFLQEVNLVGYVDSIEKDSIYVALHSGPYHTPYFALEKVEEAPTTYRPFANAEEFEPYREEWFAFTGAGHKAVTKATSYGEDGLVLGSEGDIFYKELFRDYVFADTGEPAGVKL